MLPPTSRIIRFYQCSAISTTGPQINGKLELSDIQIPYDSQFTSHMTLNPESKNQPIMYGFLGQSVTFLLLKFTYDETNPQCVIEEDQYIEYWFEDEPTTIRYANKLLLLTGNSTKRVPQIYLNNPGTVKVYVDALVANLEQEDINIEDVNNDVVLFQNLYYNSIISDTYWNCTSDISGSTQLQVIDLDDRIVLYLDYHEIDTIERNETKCELIIDTKSDTIIYLQFLSLFEMYQAHSRINWVMDLTTERYLTKDQPPLDLISPVIIQQTGVTPIYDNVYVYPFDPDPITSGFTIYPDEILNYFIYEIEDNRDGKIMVNNAAIKIREYGHVEELTGITQLGVYDIIVTVKDIANNQTMANYIIIVDDESPIITFKSGIGDVFTMIIGSSDTRVPASGVTFDDIVRKTIDNIYDTVDGVIPNSAVTLTVNGNPYTPVRIPGEYVIVYSITDRSGNESIYTKTMLVEGNVILSSGETFSISSYITYVPFIYTGEDGTFAYLVLSGRTTGTTITIMNYGDTLIWDYSGSTEHQFTTSGETITVTIDHILFKITFNGWGSLIFSVENKGRAPEFDNLRFMQYYRLVGETGYTGADIDVDVDSITHLIYLDYDSESIYNIRTNNVLFSNTGFQYTPVYLESFSYDGGITGTTTGTTLFNYYINKYPLLNTTTLDNVLKGVAPFASMFKHVDTIEIDDEIIKDEINSIVMRGDYPPDTYGFKLDIEDEEGHTNTVRFNFRIM